MKKIFSIFAAVLFAGSMMAGTYGLTNADIVAGGTAASGYQSWTTIKDSADRVWNAYAIKNKHSNATASYHFLQIKKYANNTASYIQIPDLGEAIQSITMTVSNTQKPMDGGSNTATLFFSASSATDAAGEGVVSGTGASSITIDASSLGLQTGYITAGGAVRIWDIEVTTGAGPDVVKPTINAAEDHFFDSVLVTLSCITDNAEIRYTLDGSDPTATSTLYAGVAFKLTESATVKAIAFKGEKSSAIAEKAFVKYPEFASFEELIAASLDDHSLVKVSFENLVIDSFYVSSDKKMGVYFTVNDVAYEIYKKNVEVPAAWEVNGKVSGTIRGDWYEYINNTKGIDIWEVVPSAADWAWTELTYEAPQHTAIDNTDAAVKAVKAIENGRLVIIKNGVRYDITGAELK